MSRLKTTIKQMDHLQLELDTWRSIWEDLRIDCHVEKNTDLLLPPHHYGKPSGLVLGSRDFAGIVAANDAEGWYPLYPCKATYLVGTGCKVFRPSATYMTWLHAVLASLRPDRYLEGTTDRDRRIAIRIARRLEKHRTRDAEHLLSHFADLYPEVYTDVWVEYSIASLGR